MCEKMNSYAESTDPKTGKKSYIRTSSRSGEAITLSNVAISGDISQKLKHTVSFSSIQITVAFYLLICQNEACACACISVP